MSEVRLIDANALKKAFNKWWGCDDIPATVVEDLIDNAPTVEAVSVEHHNRIKDILQNEVDSLVEIYDSERPQGKWENICTLPVIRKCSLCGVEQCGEQTIYDNFCPNCGADMRKKLQTPSCLTNPERQAELLERYKEE